MTFRPKIYFPEFAGSIPTPPDPSPTPLNVVGWASTYNSGAKVDGGGSASKVEFNDFDELWDDMQAHPTTPKNYLYTGQDAILSSANANANGEYRVDNLANKKIEATNGQLLEKMILRMQGWENVIFRNFSRKDPLNPAEPTVFEKDLISVRNSLGLVFDHCSFIGDGWDASPSRDGMLDITSESDLISILNCRFINHSKTMLIGGSNSAIADSGKLRVSVRGCLFENNSIRNPFARYGKIDWVNNVVRWVPTWQGTALNQYAWASIAEIGVECQLLARYNWFGRTYRLIRDYDDQPVKISGFKSIGNFIEGQTISPAITELRPENVVFDPLTEPNFDDGTISTNTTQVLNSVIANAGATLNLNPIV